MRLRSDLLQSTSPFKGEKLLNLSGKGVKRREGKKSTLEKFKERKYTKKYRKKNYQVDLSVLNWGNPSPRLCCACLTPLVK